MNARIELTRLWHYLQLMTVRPLAAAVTYGRRVLTPRHHLCLCGPLPRQLSIQRAVPLKHKVLIVSTSHFYGRGFFNRANQPGSAGAPPSRWQLEALLGSHIASASTNTFADVQDATRTPAPVYTGLLPVIREPHVGYLPPYTYGTYRMYAGWSVTYTWCS